jgi:hypothetical protein
MKTKVLDRHYLIPSMYQVVREESGQAPEELAEHFNDLYKLYLRRLALFEMQSTTDTARENELTSLLSELIKVKRELQVMS